MANCTAHNNEYTTTTNSDQETVFVEPLVPISGKFNSLALIEKDCPKSGSKQDIIDPELDSTHTCTDEKCAAFTFNQFAFTDASTASANPTLSFHLNCTISLGTGDSCSRRRRREADANSGEQVLVSFEVNTEGAYKLEDGIAMRSDSSDSSDMATLPLLSLFATMLLA